MRSAALAVVLFACQDLKDELPRLKATEAADARGTLSLKPGFPLELVAAEPLVSDPVDMAFDEEGRLWVAQMNDYPFGDKENHPATGKIVVLEDKDGDGRFDAARTVADHLRWVTGLALWDGGAYVVSPPDLLYVKEGTKKVVHTGLGTQNVQGLANSPRWGLDGWIYVSGGTNGGRVGELSINGRGFRFRPTGEIEAISGGGQFGQCFDDFGRRFVCSNSQQARHVVIEDRVLARNPYFAVPAVTTSIASDGDAGPVYRRSPDEPWRIVRTRMRVKGEAPGPVEFGGKVSGFFTSATGIFWHDGHLYIGDVASNLVHRKTLAPNGSTFRADRVDEKSEFLSSSDNWFRPVNFASGPDGALYVCDMYRECIEHPYSIPDSIKKHLDLTSGRDRGRIWRVKKDGAPAWKKPDLGDLAAALGRPEAWYRQTALRLLRQRRESVPESLLRHERPETRAAAAWALGKGDFLLKDPVPAVREVAVQLASVVDLDDGDPRVRLEIAFRSKDPRVLDRLRPGADKWLQWAIAIASGEKSVVKAPKASQVIVREPAPDRKKAIETYQASLGKKGDAARGKEVFAKTCAACHKKSGQGQDVGPEFATVRDKSPEDLLTAILDPNREVNPLYVAVRILTTDGAVLDGLAGAETATSVTLKREKGETDTILKVKIEKLVRSTLSLMPEGLEKTIDLQQMADLIAFIKE